DSAHDGGGLVAALFLFALSDGVGDDAGAGLNVATFAVHEERADGDAGVEIAGEVGVDNRAAVDAAAGRLELFDDLHGANLGRAGERARGEAGAQSVDGCKVGFERSFERADQMHDV